MATILIRLDMTDHFFNRDKGWGNLDREASVEAYMDLAMQEIVRSFPNRAITIMEDIAGEQVIEFYDDQGRPVRDWRAVKEETSWIAGILYEIAEGGKWARSKP